MRIVELIIDETENLSGVEAVSIVEFPAIESNFISLNQHRTCKSRWREKDFNGCCINTK